MEAPALSRRTVVWAGDPARFGWPWGGVAVLGGEDAAGLAEAVAATGSPPIAVAAPDVVVLAAQPPEGLGDDAIATATGLPPGCADTVVMRHAWAGPEELTGVVAEARRVLRPGGRLVLAGWDLDRLLSTSPHSYADAFFYAALPEVADLLLASMAYGLDLALALGRARFSEVRSLDVDEVVAEFPGRAEYLPWLRERGFRGVRHAEPERLAAVRDALPALVRSIAPIGPVAHREPWRVVGGVRPG